MDTGPLLVGIACAAALVTGFLRNAVGGGIGLALTPVPMLCWRRWDGAEARRLIPAMLVGIVLGGWLVAGGVGLVAGFASTAAHSGGVVLGLYLVGRPLSSAGVVATGTLVHAISDVVKVGT
jgi:hypothetical protein